MRRVRKKLRDQVSASPCTAKSRFGFRNLGGNGSGRKPPTEAQIKKSNRNLELWEMSSKGCLEAREALISENMPLAIHVATSWQLRLPIADIVHIGRKAMSKAIDHFDPKKGGFSQYAVYWIRQEFEQDMAHSRVVELTSGAMTKLRKIERAIWEFSAKNGREPTIDEISERTGLGRRAILTVLNSPSKRLHLDNHPDGECPIAIPDSGPSPYESLAANDRSAELRSVISQLEKRESDIIRMRFGLDTGHEMTYTEVGKVLNISRERVRQIIERVIRKIRRDLDGKNLMSILSDK